MAMILSAAFNMKRKPKDIIIYLRKGLRSLILTWPKDKEQDN
jgi:hypothetical protein